MKLILHHTLLLLLAAALVGTPGCRKAPPSPFLLPGLTLPPTAMITAPATNKPGDKVLVVMFKDSSGWTAVRQHVESHLLAHGFKDITTQTEQQLTDIAPNFGTTIRMYSSPDFMVSLTDDEGGFQQLQKAGGTSVPVPASVDDTFTLSVTKLH